MYETGRRIVDPGAEGREDGELVFRGGTVSVWEDGKFLEVEGGNDCTI